MGYHRAGHSVFGVDNQAQPNYPFDMVIADANDYPLDGYDFIHASPPCQDHSNLSAYTGGHGTGWMLSNIRERLENWGRRWVIENVPGAYMPGAITLCGTMMKLTAGEYALKRHRLFQFGWTVAFEPKHSCHGYPIKGVYGQTGSSTFAKKFNTVEAKEAMGIDWMRHEELVQAIPPAYTEWICKNYLIQPD